MVTGILVSCNRLTPCGLQRLAAGHSNIELIAKIHLGFSGTNLLIMRIIQVHVDSRTRCMFASINFYSRAAARLSNFFLIDLPVDFYFYHIALRSASAAYINVF